MNRDNRYTGKTNAVHRPKKGERLKAKTINDIQDSIANLQRGFAPFSDPRIELVKLSANLSFGNSVDAVIQGYDNTTSDYDDLAVHAKRSVLNPYPNSFFPQDMVIPVVRVAGAVVPVMECTSVVAYTPSGGIAARSGSTVSSASCTVYDRSGSTISASSPSRSVAVYNLSTTAVAASVYIVATLTNIGYVAVWEDC